MPAPEVRNAADPAEVKGAVRRTRRREQRFFDCLRSVLSTPEGRLVFGELEHGLIARTGVYRSVWSPDARIHYNAGRQDFGHELVGLVIQADEAAYLTMETESRALARRDAGETDAAAMSAAANRETTNGR